MGISSNIIWHETTKKGLFGIIKDNGFRFAYSSESFRPDSDASRLAYPMISFCDLPMSELGNMIGKYGGYVIGLSKEWKKAADAIPVWYCGGNAVVRDYILETMYQVSEYLRARKDKQAKKMNNELLDALCKLLSSIKPFEGPLPKRNFQNYRFYDERECRVIPHGGYYDSQKKFITHKEYEKHKERFHSSLVDTTAFPIVPVSKDDIKVIIVNKKDEVEEVTALLKKFELFSNQLIIDSDFVINDIIGQFHSNK